MNCNHDDLVSLDHIWPLAHPHPPDIEQHDPAAGLPL